MDLPGVKRDNIEISLENGRLVVCDGRNHAEEEKANTYLYSERTHGRFSRTIKLVSPVNPNEVEAEFKDGVLVIRLRKLEGFETRKIALKG